MATLEQEVLEKYQQLDPAAKQRVKRKIQEESTKVPTQDSQRFDYVAWLDRLDELHEQVQRNHGGVFPKVDTVQMLREVRDEEG